MIDISLRHRHLQDFFLKFQIGNTIYIFLTRLQINPISSNLPQQTVHSPQLPIATVLNKLLRTLLLQRPLSHNPVMKSMVIFHRLQDLLFPYFLFQLNSLGGEDDSCLRKMISYTVAAYL